jgi:glutaminyl-peptide cyclotransferase
VRTALGLALLLMVTGPHRAPGFVVAQPAGASLPRYTYTLVRSYPHDATAFTQGLQYVDGFLYEGTGNHGASSIRKVNLETGEVLQKRDLPQQYFGEGIVVRRDELVQLTYQTEIGFVYDRHTFAPKRTFKYQGEGWGLTEDGKNLIMSDGSDRLRVLDPATLKELRRIPVTAGGAPVRNLNELEWVRGEIFANIWQTDYIARIDPATGRVTGWIDLRGLLSPRERAKTDVLNGIAYDAASDRLFVTGKWWPRVFEIKLVAK